MTPSPRFRPPTRVNCRPTGRYRPHGRQLGPVRPVRAPTPRRGRRRQQPAAAATRSGCGARRSPSGRRPSSRHDVHVEVRHRLADPVVDGHERALRAHRRLDHPLHRRHPLEERSDAIGGHVGQGLDVHSGRDQHVAVEQRRGCRGRRRSRRRRRRSSPARRRRRCGTTGRSHDGERDRGGAVFEYGHTSWAWATSCSAASRSTLGSDTSSATSSPNPPLSSIPMPTVADTSDPLARPSPVRRRASTPSGSTPLAGGEELLRVGRAAGAAHRRRDPQVEVDHAVLGRSVTSCAHRPLRSSSCRGCSCSFVVCAAATLPRRRCFRARPPARPTPWRATASAGSRAPPGDRVDGGEEQQDGAVDDELRAGRREVDPADVLTSGRPLSIVATTRPPTTVDHLPRPPNRLMPPMAAAPTARSSVSLPPVCGYTELSCEASAMPATRARRRQMMKQHPHPDDVDAGAARRFGVAADGVARAGPTPCGEQEVSTTTSPSTIGTAIGTPCRLAAAAGSVEDVRAAAPHDGDRCRLDADDDRPRRPGPPAGAGAARPRRTPR